MAAPELDEDNAAAAPELSEDDAMAAPELDEADAMAAPELRVPVCSVCSCVQMQDAHASRPPLLESECADASRPRRPPPPAAVRS